MKSRAERSTAGIPPVTSPSRGLVLPSIHKESTMASANSQPHPPSNTLSKGGAAFRGRGIEESNASTPPVNSKGTTLSSVSTVSPPATSRKQQLLTPKSNAPAGAGQRSGRANNGERTPSTTLTPRSFLGVPSSASSSRSPSKPLALSPFAKDLTKKGRPVPKGEWNDSTAVPKPIDVSLGKGRLSNAETGGGEALPTEVGKLLEGLSPSPPHTVGSTQISPKPLTAPGGGSSVSPRQLQKLLQKGEKHDEGDGLSATKIPRPPPSTLTSSLSLADGYNDFSSTFSATNGMSPRNGGSVAKRYETDRFAKSLSERAAANEALKLLVNRMFKGGFEEQERRRLKIEMKEQDGFAEILDNFSDEYTKAQKREQQNNCKGAILTIKETVGKEETKGRRQASEEELSARLSLEQAARQSVRMINKMSKFSQQQEAERDRFISEETRRRTNYEDDEKEKAATLANKRMLLMAKVRADAGKYEERLAMENELKRRRWDEGREQQRLELGDDERTQRGVTEVEEAEKRKEIKSIALKESQTLQTLRNIREGLRQVEEQESDVRENGWGRATASSKGSKDNVFRSAEFRSVAKAEEEAFAFIVRKAAEVLVAIQQSAIDRKSNQKKEREALEADEEVRREFIVDEASVTFENDIEKAAERNKVSLLGAAAEAAQRLSEERRTLERDEESARKTILQESHQLFERNISTASEVEKKALEDLRRSKLAAISKELHDLVALSVTTSDSLFEEASRIFKSTITDVFISQKDAILKAHAAIVEIEDDEEGARALVLAEEEKQFQNGLVAGRDQSYKLANDARLRREEEERRNESNLTAQLEAAADTELQQAMLNNKRQERTRQLKQQEQGGGSDSGNGGSGDNPNDTVPKSKFELLLDTWIKPLVNLYLKLDDLVSKGESADSAMSEYNSMKIKFAMQLAQFKRANPVKASVAKNAATTNLSLRHTNNHNIALEMSLGGSKKGDLSPLTQAEFDDLHRRIRATRLVRPFFELLVRDTDANRPNVTLMSTLLTDNLPVDFAAIIREDNLLADAAVDGSVSYFDTFLGVPGLNVEPARSAELMTMALTNPKKRIQFAETILRREHALGTMTLKNEMASIWQRFLIQVGGSVDLPSDIAGLDRRPTVLSQMFNRSHSVLVDVSAPATEKVCPVTRDTVMTRLAILGDFDTFQVLLKSADTQQFGDALITPRPSDGLTPLMLAIDNNRAGFVQMLLQFPHVRKTIRYQEAHDEGSSGRARATAYEIASNSTTCDDTIVEMVLGCGDGDEAPALSDALAMSISSNAHVREIQQRFASFSPSATATMGMTFASSTSAGAITEGSSSPPKAAAAAGRSRASKKASESLGIGSLTRLGGSDDDDNYFGGDDDVTLALPTLSPLKFKNNNNTAGLEVTSVSDASPKPPASSAKLAPQAHKDTFGNSLDGLDDSSSGSLMGDDMEDSPQKSAPTAVINTKQQQQRQPVVMTAGVATTAVANSAFYGGESDAIGGGWDDDEIDLEGGFSDSEDEL